MLSKNEKTFASVGSRVRETLGNKTLTKVAPIASTAGKSSATMNHRFMRKDTPNGFLMLSWNINFWVIIADIIGVNIKITAMISQGTV